MKMGFQSHQPFVRLLDKLKIRNFYLTKSNDCSYKHFSKIKEKQYDNQSFYSKTGQ